MPRSSYVRLLQKAAAGLHYSLRDDQLLFISVLVSVESGHYQANIIFVEAFYRLTDGQ